MRYLALTALALGALYLGWKYLFGAPLATLLKEQSWLPVIIPGALLSVAVVYLLYRLSPLLLIFDFKLKTLMISLLSIAALNAFLYWLLPEDWLYHGWPWATEEVKKVLEIAAKDKNVQKPQLLWHPFFIFWTVQTVGVLLTLSMVNRARRWKPLKAALAGIPFLGIAWLTTTYKPGELMPQILESTKSFLESEHRLEPSSSREPQVKRKVGTASWVMPRGVEGKYKNERSSVNRVEIIQLDDKIFHYITFCRHTGRKFCELYWNRETSKRGTWRLVDSLHGNEVRTGNWYLIQDSNNPLIYQGAWSGPLDSGGKDVPYKLVIDP
jgi:hypothetical protein